MTRHHHSSTIGCAIFAIVLSCFTGSLFAQSTDQSSDQDSPSAQSAVPKTTTSDLHYTPPSWPYETELQGTVEYIADVLAKIKADQPIDSQLNHPANRRFIYHKS
jgi:hypothetical protein